MQIQTAGRERGWSAGFNPVKMARESGLYQPAERPDLAFGQFLFPAAPEQAYIRRLGSLQQPGGLLSIGVGQRDQLSIVAFRRLERHEGGGEIREDGQFYLDLNDRGEVIKFGSDSGGSLTTLSGVSTSEPGTPYRRIDYSVSLETGGRYMVLLKSKLLRLTSGGRVEDLKEAQDEGLRLAREAGYPDKADLERTLREWLTNPDFTAGKYRTEKFSPPESA